MAERIPHTRLLSACHILLRLSSEPEPGSGGDWQADGENDGNGAAASHMTDIRRLRAGGERSRMHASYRVVAHLAESWITSLDG